MKGTIVKCLEEMVKGGKSGGEAWTAILGKAGLPPTTRFMTTAVVPDGEVMKLIKSAAEVLGLQLQAALDAFGEYWSSKYAPSIYGAYFGQAKGAREFLLKMNDVHVQMTRLAGAQPPKFTFEDLGPKKLTMRYSSPRGLGALMPGLIRGVAKHYHERVEVRAEGDTMHITFA